MAPEPRRKDRTRHRERPEGEEAAEEEGRSPPEEYTDYHETDPDAPDGSPQPDREADLQPDEDAPRKP